eukprot:6212651-Pleurochrysis_carterae.AAC.6
MLPVLSTGLRYIQRKLHCEPAHGHDMHMDTSSLLPGALVLPLDLTARTVEARAGDGGVAHDAVHAWVVFAHGIEHAAEQVEAGPAGGGCASDFRDGAVGQAASRQRRAVWVAGKEQARQLELEPKRQPHAERRQVDAHVGGEGAARPEQREAAARGEVFRRRRRVVRVFRHVLVGRGRAQVHLRCRHLLRRDADTARLGYAHKHRTAPIARGNVRSRPHRQVEPPQILVLDRERHHNAGHTAHWLPVVGRLDPQRPVLHAHAHRAPHGAHEAHEHQRRDH